MEHGLAPIGRPPVLPRAGRNPRHGIAAHTDSVGHKNNTLATTTGHLASLYGNSPFRKIPRIGTSTRFFCHEYGQKLPGQGKPLCGTWPCSYLTTPVLPRASLNPRYGIATQTDLVGHQNNTLAMTTSHLASLYGNYPFGENTRDW